MRRFAILLLLVAIVAAIGPRPVSAQSAIQPFFGEYAGRTLFPMGEQRNRDLRVWIRPFGTFGFTVEWETTIYRQKNQPEPKTQVYDFEPSAQTNVYIARSKSAKPDANGAQPQTLVLGEPYAWAKLADKTLTVNVLTIDDSGDYVVQTYDRTLTEKGMTFDFLRLRNGKIERQLKGDLKRIAD